MDENIRKLQDWIDESQNIVFFGGAGVSTESGIPDFRSTDGLYHQQYDYPPETILSHTFFEKNPAEFYRFYRDKMIVQGAKPNAAHLKLAELERAGKLKAVVTQNIDGLHQAAGSKVVYELLHPLPEEVSPLLHRRVHRRPPLHGTQLRRHRPPGRGAV